MGQNYPIYATRYDRRIGFFRDWKLMLTLVKPKTTSNVMPITEGKSPAKESDNKGYVIARDASKNKFTDPKGDFGSTMKQVESSSSEDVHHVAPKLNTFDPNPKQGAALEAIVITLGEASISQKGTKGHKCL
ncbi:hypothetical protein SELMODRAFT_404840 [Selaginella moellendorffii]|uniref:Uncharacterized protein n=1 Tax=Selaginella moellendorffii TaxID=88036 RepID=D8QXI9_SELML|nr:hypothetical protein SELMODRAFT_404840 [Selaginella moellendorffii]